MDPFCAILTMLLLIQMIIVLAMLNPSYDVRKITNYINVKAKTHKSWVSVAAALYFGMIFFIGVYTPLQSVIEQVLTDEPEYEKLLTLVNIEKNCIMTGFSLFLVVVFYGINSLIAYSACLMDISDRQALPLSQPNPKLSTINVKRSFSYESVLFPKELREQLNMILRNSGFSNHKFKLPRIPGVPVTNF